MKFLTGSERFGRTRLGFLLRTIGVVTFLLSVASPYDDGIQQEFFRPRSSHVVFRRLPSAIHGIRKSRVVTEIVARDREFPMPELFASVTPANVLGSLIPLFSTLVPRSPPLR